MQQRLQCHAIARVRATPVRQRVRQAIRESEKTPARFQKPSVVDGNRLVIYVDLNHSGNISASGKTRRVASTEGNIGVKDANGVEAKVGLNVYVKPDI